jgi:hypothetical protein
MLRVREPIERPLDVIAAEIGVTVSQALLAGLLAHLATGFWLERGVATGSVVAIFTLAALAIAGAWLYWLLGGDGWPMAIACLPIGLVLGFALVLSVRGAQFDELNVAITLVAIGCAAYGVVAGFFLDSPRRWRWNQRRVPRHGAVVPRLSPTGESILRHVPRARPSRSFGMPSLRVRRAGPVMTAGPSSAERGGQTGEPVVRMATPRPIGTRTEPARRLQASVASGPHEPEQAVPVIEPRSGAAEPRGDASDAQRGGATRAEPYDLFDTGADIHQGIDLPTTDEPRARRSPWAWASPPEWSRDDLDEEGGAPPPRRTR